ncbi:MAG: hypothetical protein JW982_10850 [Spirochaetes bacterium]|nr:hypothetical protein [Spirochaetota bacterium]
MKNPNKQWRLVFNLIILGLLVFSSGCISFKPAYEKDDVITGNWDQYMLTGKDYIYGGTFSVTFSDGKYSMKYVKQRDDVVIYTESGVIGIINSSDLFDISFTKGVWRFSSDWGSGNIGEFRLIMKSRDIFEGWSYLNGEKRTSNLWIRSK